MAYIGREPTVGNFQVCDAISVVNNQAAYTMQVGGVNVSPESSQHMLVSLNGVIQKNGGTNPSFTVSGSTITFASNLVTGDVIDFIQILGNVLDLGVPSDGTVTPAKLSGVTEGIKVADQWRLTANITTNADITTNLERVDDASFAKIGTGMTVSSGVWSFPSTGLYQIFTTAKGNSSSTNDTWRINVYVSTDGGSSYDYISEVTLGSTSSNTVAEMATNTNFVNVTNTTNVKVKFETSSLSAGSVIEGITDYNKSAFTFIRLGDSQ